MGEAKDQRGPNTHTREEDDVRHRLFLPPLPSHTMNDFGRYKRTRQSPQVADVPSTLQPAKTIDETPIIHSDNVMQPLSKDTGYESEAETWSFDRAINEVFRLLLQELCPKPTEENTPRKPLSGIEHLMESRATPLLVLPQSKQEENTTFIQNKIDSKNFGKDWLCPQNLVLSLAPTKYYNSQNQYFPTDKLP